MATLLLRLAAPLQAWGTDSKFETRRTNREPSKSGVLGMLAAALGIRRDEPEKLVQLSHLRFGVRVDNEGDILCDYHIAKSVKTSYVTYRHYLQDAVFLVGLESDDIAFLKELEYALQHPVFPLFLGRRSCPPTFPLVKRIRDVDLMTALYSEPWLLSEKRQRKQINRNKGSMKLRIITDTPSGQFSPAVQRDVPISFDPRHRKFADRAVSLQKPLAVYCAQSQEHDPMLELEDEGCI